MSTNNARTRTPMDFSARIDDLARKRVTATKTLGSTAAAKERVTAVKTSVEAAADETHQQLSQRTDTAQTDADRALSQAKQDGRLPRPSRAKDAWEQSPGRRAGHAWRC